MRKEKEVVSEYGGKGSFHEMKEGITLLEVSWEQRWNKKDVFKFSFFFF